MALQACTRLSLWNRCHTTSTSMRMAMMAGRLAITARSASRAKSRTKIRALEGPARGLATNSANEAQSRSTSAPRPSNLTTSQRLTITGKKRANACLQLMAAMATPTTRRPEKVSPMVTGAKIRLSAVRVGDTIAVAHSKTRSNLQLRWAATKRRRRISTSISTKTATAATSTLPCRASRLRPKKCAIQPSAAAAAKATSSS